MSIREGDVGKHGTVFFADGTVRARGKILAHSIVPSVLIETEAGERVLVETRHGAGGSPRDDHGGQPVRPVVRSRTRPDRRPHPGPHAMTDLAAQILAALDRDEETARAATPGPWRTYDDPTKGFSTGCDAGVTSTSRDVENPPVVLYEGQVVTEDAAHIAANDPAHVLRLCAALREVVKLHAGEDDPCQHDLGPFVLHDGPVEFSRDSRGNPVSSRPIGYQEDLGCPTLVALASAWDVPGVAE